MTQREIPMEGFKERKEGTLAGCWVIRNRLHHAAGYFQVRDPKDDVNMIVTFDSEEDAQTFIDRYGVTEGEPYHVPQQH